MPSFVNAVIIVLLCPFLSACSDSETTASPEATTPVPILDGNLTHPGSEDWQFDEISRFEVEIEEGSREVVLIEAQHRSGSKHYLQYVPSSRVGAPLMIINEPYWGIDWSNDSVDADWAARGKGNHADDYAPDYQGRDIIPYQTISTETAVSGTEIWRRHGFATLTTFGRFYAGSSLEGDVLDAMAPYYYAASLPSTLRPGATFATGGSWGGMMALFGSHAVPASLKPKAVSVFSPLTNIGQQLEYVSLLYADTALEQDRVRGYFSPYLRRMKAALTPDVLPISYVTLSGSTLCEQLPGAVLILHDDRDTIVPVAQTEALASSCPDKVAAVYWRRDETADPALGLNHGGFNDEGGIPDAKTISQAWLLDAAGVEPRLVTASSANLQGFFNLLATARSNGESIAFADEALRVLTDDALSLVDDTSGETVSGLAYITPLVNAAFGMELKPEELKQYVTSLVAP